MEGEIYSISIFQVLSVDYFYILHRKEVNLKPYAEVMFTNILSFCQT